MGFVFRKSFKVAPGVNLNVSKKGMGVSVGGRNTPRVSVNSSGRVTKSVRLAPGLRYQETSTLGKKRKQRQPKTEPIEQLTPSDSEPVPTYEVKVVSKEPRSLFLPHSIWSVLFFALGGFLSATQESYDRFAFFVFAMAVLFGLTYVWNLITKDRDQE
jgi:hypothetical protein